MRGEAVRCDYCGQLRPRNKKDCPRCSATEGQVLNMPYDVQCAFCKGWRSGVESECPTCGAGEAEEPERYTPYPDGGDYFFKGGVSLCQEWEPRHFTDWELPDGTLTAPLYHPGDISQPNWIDAPEVRAFLARRSDKRRWSKRAAARLKELWQQGR